MGWVYLIGEADIPNHFKIGSTRAENIEKRIKQLQTGNSSPLYLHDSFQTSQPFKLEKMLHNRFKSCNMINEWFDLNKEDVRDFKAVCEEYQSIINALNDNPFFNKRTIYNKNRKCLKR